MSRSVGRWSRRRRRRFPARPLGSRLRSVGRVCEMSTSVLFLERLLALVERRGLCRNSDGFIPFRGYFESVFYTRFIIRPCLRAGLATENCEVRERVLSYFLLSEIMP